MRDGFVRVAAGTPVVRVGDTAANAREVIHLMREAGARDCKLLVLPELCLTGYTCGDLFFQQTLIRSALNALDDVRKASEGLDLLTVVGMPIEHCGALYDCAVAVKDGEILGVVPKDGLSRAECRWFAPGDEADTEITLLDEVAPFSCDLLLAAEGMGAFTVGVAFAGEAGPHDTPAILACPVAVAETVGSADKMALAARQRSLDWVSAIVMAGAGQGESSTDYVFGGRRLLIECGRTIAASGCYQPGLTVSEIDLGYILARRNREGLVFGTGQSTCVTFPVKLTDLALTRTFEKLPFVPSDQRLRAERCEQILNIQAQGLAQRMRHIGCNTAVLGVSGGLDSTLAMLVIARALKLLDLPMSGLLGVTMPCYGTTERTKGNAHKLSEALGSELREINIAAAVTQHLSDIGHDLNTHDVTYENAQARERTQVLMDLANMTSGLVVGTGDMSELSLGWATYSGDHMAMYGVNAGVPKTLVRHLVSYAASQAEGALAQVLRDIVDTPVSPELLPPVDGVISQKTEELVGPYELHDFFLYHMIRRMSEPRKIKRLAVQSFAGEYDEDTIDKWLEKFLRRFFSQQFKRSCAPDAPKIGSVGLSPRGDLSMPSDAVAAMWIQNLHS